MFRISIFGLAAFQLYAQKPENVLIVVNQASAVSKSITEYYARKRSIPTANVCRINTPPAEHIERAVFTRDIEIPVARCLAAGKLTARILYIVTTLGVPLGIRGSEGADGDSAAVDSELTLLYSTIHGKQHKTAGAVPNPMFMQHKVPFTHERFPIYLVTRLAAYDFATVRNMIDRSVEAANRGKVVLDLRNTGDPTGDEWLRDAAIRLPDGRVVFNDTKGVLYRQSDVIAYAAWGSNDPNRKERHVHFKWLPGAIMTEFVSSNGRTFERPPEIWNISTWNKKDEPKWFKGSPQTLSADYLMEGATGASGHVYEPYLRFCPRPDHVLPAYVRDGRNLAESFYLGIPGLSWMNIVLGDPLCRLGPSK